MCWWSHLEWESAQKQPSSGVMIVSSRTYTWPPAVSHVSFRIKWPDLIMNAWACTKVKKNYLKWPACGKIYLKNSWSFLFGRALDEIMEEEEGFMTCAGVCHHSMIKLYWLYFWEALALPLFKYRLFMGQVIDIHYMYLLTDILVTYWGRGRLAVCPLGFYCDCSVLPQDGSTGLMWVGSLHVEMKNTLRKIDVI